MVEPASYSTISEPYTIQQTTYYSFIASPPGLQESLFSPPQQKIQMHPKDKKCGNYLQSALNSSGYETDTGTTSEAFVEESLSLPSFDKAPLRDEASVKTQCVRHAKQISDDILLVCQAEDRRSHFLRILSKEDRNRLGFLRETLALILGFLSQLQSDCEALDKLLFALKKQLVETQTMLSRILTQQAAITANFDIFELTLRRYLEELQWMFPLQSNLSPVDRIQDDRAKLAWINAFGKRELYVTFDEFVNMLSQVFEGFVQNRAFRQFLRYFIDFPTINLVTAYKWNQLITLFGPFNEFGNNFYRIALGKGFLGLINRIQAQEVLAMEHNDKCLLVRFSRTQPNFLAFSYKDTTRSSGPVMGHKINKDSHGSPIPIDTFLRTNFPGFKLVSSHINLNAIFDCPSTSLCQYAERTKGYVAFSAPMRSEGCCA